MSKSFFKLANGNFAQDWSDTSLLTTNNDWSGVESIVGYRGDGLASPAGKNPSLIVADSTVVNLIANQTNTSLSTGGIAEFQIADPVVALQGSGTAQAPGLVIYLDASGRQGLHFAVDLRDIDGSGDNAIQQVAVQYRIGDSGNWTNLPAGYVADTSTGPNEATRVTHVEFDLPGALDNQSQVELRILTTDAVSSDEWVGIDNIRVTSNAISADHTAPLLSGSSPSDGQIGIAPQANLTLNFNELIATGSGDITITDGAGDTRTIAVNDSSQVSVSGQTLVINPSANLQLGTNYHVSVAAGAVLDLAGNAYAGTDGNPIDFKTIAALTHTYEIQGAGHTSELVGQLVNTRGVVTAIDTTSTRGFWIQDQAGDGNDATSDAVFVFSTSASAAVHVGDLVELQGVVDEYAGSNANNLSVTEVTNVQNLQILSSGNVIAPTIFGSGGRIAPTEVVDSDNFAVFNPDHDAIDFYESLEGMLLVAKDVQATGNTDSGATYAVTDNGAHATGMNDRGAITAGANDPNPERFQIYADSGVNPAFVPAYSTGDKLGDVTGIMHYFGGNYELIPTVVPAAAVSMVITEDVTALQGDASHLTVGAYNLENIDINDGAIKFSTIANDIVSNLKLPDILGLEEIQDNNGTGKGVLASDVTLDTLVAAIVAAGGPQYAWVVIDPTVENGNGGESNGNIRNAILYNPARVDFVEGSLRQIDDTTPANGDGYRNSRHPIVADFAFHGEAVTFVGVHNYSRLGSDELFGLNQPAFNSGDDRRNDQTAAVAEYVNALRAANPDANVVVAGDFNAFHYETSLTQVEAAGMTNLVWSLPATDRYSSSFEGNDQQIDHLLVTNNLAATAQFDNVHLNSNQPLGAYVPTDHDAVLSRLYLNGAPVAVVDAVFAASEDVLLTVDAAHGVLANDTDRNGDTLSAVLGTGPAHGTLALHADGSFTYQGAADYNGSDSFTYLANDGVGGVSAEVTVQLAVAAVSDAASANGGNKADSFIDASGFDTTYHAGNGNDTVNGGDGADKLYGENGEDILIGGSEGDLLDGGNGSDILFGGAGADTLSGGNGPDVFVFAPGSGRDVVLDFAFSNDVLATGYSGSGANLAAWVDGLGKSKAATVGFTFTDADLDGNGKADAVVISGGALGDDAIVIGSVTVATLTQQGHLNAAHQAVGGWLV